MTSRSDTTQRCWVGPEREPPHLHRRTLFVQGEVEWQRVLYLADRHQVDAIYFGAGSRDLFDPEAVTWAALHSGRAVVVECRSLEIVRAIPPGVRHLVELVVTFDDSNEWRELRFKREQWPRLSFYTDARWTEVVVDDPAQDRWQGDKIVWEQETR